jgi:hypothetical protein
VLLAGESVRADVTPPRAQRGRESNTVARACKLLQELAGEPAELFLTRLTGDRKPSSGDEYWGLSKLRFVARFSSGDLFRVATVDDAAVSEVTLVLRRAMPRDAFLRATGLEQSFKLTEGSGCTIGPNRGPQGEIRGVHVSLPRRGAID